MADIKTTSASPADERQQAVEELYLHNFSMIRELCESDPTLNFDTTEKMAEALAGYLNNYSGPLTPEAFQEWITGIVLPALSFAAIYKECGEYVSAAIRKVLLPCIDLGVTGHHLQDAEQTTWFWAWEHLDSLRAQGQKAKPKTRLYSVAKFKALSIRKTRLRARERFKTIDLKRVGADPYEAEWSGLVVEPLPPTEERDDPYQRRETVGPQAA